MVLTESDSDVILVEPMKNCTSGEMIDAAATSSKQNCFFYDLAPKCLGLNDNEMPWSGCLKSSISKIRLSQDTVSKSRLL